MQSLITTFGNIVLGIVVLILALLALAVVGIVVWLLGVAVSAFLWVFIPVALIAIGFALFADHERKPHRD